MYKGILTTAPALAIYAVLHVLLRAPVSQAILMLPLLFLFQTAMNLGFALLFSTLTVYFKDMSNLMTYILRILTFATPVVYPVATLPAERPAAAHLEPAVPALLGVSGRHHGPDAFERADPRVHVLVRIAGGGRGLVVPPLRACVCSLCLTRATDTHLQSRWITSPRRISVRGTQPRGPVGPACPRHPRPRRGARGTGVARRLVHRPEGLGARRHRAQRCRQVDAAANGVRHPRAEAKGRVVVHGRISPLLSVGLGMHPSSPAGRTSGSGGWRSGTG